MGLMDEFESAVRKGLDGREGQFRAPLNRLHIDAETDEEAIACFLDEYAQSPETARAYDKEIRRFRMWAVLVAGKSLPNVSRDDCIAYIEFLKEPDPDWVQQPVNGKYSRILQGAPEWRPFKGGLGTSAILSAIAALNSCFSWLVDSGYLTGNPLGLARQARKLAGATTVAQDDKRIERYLDDDMWAAFTLAIDRMPTKTPEETLVAERMRFLASMLALLGPRVSEISAGQMGHFRKTEAGWFWHVVGKGSKFARVAVPPDMLKALMRWRAYLGLSKVPSSKETFPLLPPFNKNSQVVANRGGISPRRINQLLDEAFAYAARLIEHDHPDKAEILRQASAHWGRHTSVTQKIKSGMDRAMVQKDARHADAKTTGMYSHDEDRLRVEEAKKHQLHWAGK